MLVLINGTYAVGKTTVARILEESFLDSSFEVFDPDGFDFENLLNEKEQLAILLGGTDLLTKPIYLYLIRNEIQSRLLKSKSVIVPITMANEAGKKIIIDYFIGQGFQLLHFILQASRETILDRMRNQKERDESLVLNLTAKNIAFLNKYLDAIKIDTENKTPYQVAKNISEYLRNTELMCTHNIDSGFTDMYPTKIEW